jgi:hypothetical protein
VPRDGDEGWYGTAQAEPQHPTEPKRGIFVRSGRRPRVVGAQDVVHRRSGRDSERVHPGRDGAVEARRAASIAVASLDPDLSSSVSVTLCELVAVTTASMLPEPTIRR